MAYHGNDFSATEDEAIRAGYEAGTTLAVICRRIGRSLASTGSRAQYLGLEHPFGTRRKDSKWRNQYMTADLPTLAHVPGISVTGRYSMREA